MATRLRRRGPRDNTGLVMTFSSRAGGVGISAGQKFRPQILLAPFDGPVLSARSDWDLALHLRGRPIQISDTQVQEASGWADVFNHSCDPNTGLRLIQGVYWLVTMRTIRWGEELCWDYAMSQWSDEFFFYPPCRCKCGSTLCRGDHLGAESLPLTVAQKYLKGRWGTTFIREKLQSRVSGEP